MTKPILSASAMEKLLKKSGAIRVSENAKTALREILEEHSDNLGKKAIDLAKHSGRKTIKQEDIKLAFKT